MGLLRKQDHEAFKLFKNVVTFFPQVTRTDKMHFLVPGKILNKMVLKSALSKIFLAKPVFLPVSTGLYAQEGNLCVRCYLRVYSHCVADTPRLAA